jgi:hypothetical protein
MLVETMEVGVGVEFEAELRIHIAVYHHYHHYVKPQRVPIPRIFLAYLLYKKILIY